MMPSISKELVVGAAAGGVLGCVFGYTASRGFSLSLGSNRDSSGEPSENIVHKTTSRNASPMDRYVVENSLREVPVLEDLRKHTFDNVKMSVMLTDPVEAQFFCVLLKMLDAKKCIEVGTYTGYNALNMALMLPDDGKVFALDIDETYVNNGKPFFQQAGQANKIDIRIGPAADSMDSLIAEGHSGTVDFVYIDADKKGYDTYYEKALVLLRRGGMVAMDNMFQGGRVINPSESTGGYRIAAEALHMLNQKVMKDQRVMTSLLKIADGVNLCLKL